MRIIIVLSALIIASSCSYNSEKLPIPEVSNPVVPLEITYNKHTKRLFDTYCISCHAPGATQQFFPLTNFSEVSFYSGSGGLIERRVLGQMNMPPTASQTGQLTVAEKDTLQMWIDQGSKQ